MDPLEIPLIISLKSTFANDGSEPDACFDGGSFGDTALLSTS
jgi:hypothetical protein